MTTAPARKKVSKDSLGDRMKGYEAREGLSHLRMCPVVARMDGRSFHSFTKGLERPYDARLSRLMVETTRFLVAQSNALIGYTQSDEITLVFNAEDYESEIMFDGKHDKIVSILASMTTGIFNRLLPSFLPERSNLFLHDSTCPASELGFSAITCDCGLPQKMQNANLPQFDARVFTVPNLVEAANCLVWREQDATRNSVQMAARASFSHTECHLKNRSALMDMLHTKGINWNDYPAFFKRGTYLKRSVIKRFLTESELDRIPEPQRSMMAQNEIVRTIVSELDMPPYSQIEDRVSAYFGAA